MKNNILSIFSFILLSILFSCTGQKIKSNMETYDFETMKNSSVNPLAIERNGWIVVMYKMTESGAYYNEFPPTPNFYKIVKNFYPNGRLKSVGKVTGQFLNIGTWQYFDENGNLNKEIDENEKFGRIKLNDILKFLEKEGHINLSTGEGRDYAVIEENDKGVIYYGNFYLNLNEEKSYWIIVIEPKPKNGFNKTTYHVDKNSGEVFFKETEKVYYIK